MAMITCPECGGSISNKADRCIHCGCRIITCPECETVYIQEVPVCKECGYAFQKKPAPPPAAPKPAAPKPAPKGPTLNTLMDVNGLWLKEKPPEYSGGAARIIEMVLLGVIVACIIAWNFGNTSLFGDFGSSGLIMLCLIGFGICVIINTIFVYLVNTPGRAENQFLFWANNRRIDMKALIKREIMSPKSNMTAEQYEACLSRIDGAVKTMVYAEDPSRRSKLVGMAVLHYILSAVAFFLFMWFVIANMPIYLAAELTDSYELSMVICWWALIASVVIMIVSGVTDNSEYRDDALVKNWLQKNMPETVETHDAILAEHKRLEKLVKKYGKDDEPTQE